MKIIVLLFLILAMTCCDKELNYDFIVENTTKNTIIVSFTDFNEEKYSFFVKSNDIDTIYRKKVASNAGVHEFELQSYFLIFTVKFDSLTSNVNYRSNTSWMYFENSKSYAVYYLKIDSTHFK